MSAVVPCPRPRLVTEGGRRVARLSKATRLAAEPATTAARLHRSLEAIYAEGVHALAAVMEAQQASQAALVTIAHRDPLVSRALAREAAISAGMSAKRLGHLLSMIERANRGSPCR